jgi:5-methyltetrahydrofolate--homocysteine methyltransferase
MEKYKRTMKKSLRNFMAENVVFMDGGMGTCLADLDLVESAFGGKPFGFSDWLCLSSQDAVLNVHRRYFEAGVDLIETNTLGANRVKLGEYQEENSVEKLNLAAATLACQAREEFSEKQKRPCFVAGSIGPTGYLPTSENLESSTLTFGEFKEIFKQQAGALIKGGVDALLMETQQDLIELKAGIIGCREAIAESKKDIVLMASVTLLPPAMTMLMGNDLLAVHETLARLGLDVFGINCATGPTEMRNQIFRLCANSPCKVMVMPNAGMPVNNAQGKAAFNLKPAAFSQAMRELVLEAGIDFAGGCCGTGPEHLALLVKELGRIKPRRLLKAINFEPAAASLIKRVSFKQSPAPLIIGERLNAQGSRIFKELLLKEDYQGMLEIAARQVENGAHILDICTAVTEKEIEKESMVRLVKKLSLRLDTPLMIDSTQSDVIEAALEVLPGRAIVNSINLEGGGEKLKALAPVAAKFGAACVALCIDENGMAKDRQAKLKVAQKLIEAVKPYGLDEQDLLIDTLTFTLASGEEEYKNSAVETIEGIKLVKQNYPRAFTILGLSNISFGLPPQIRTLVNSVFLKHCLAAGLDAAIVHPGQILALEEQDPVALEKAQDLVLNRNPRALTDLLEFFEKQKKTDQVTAVSIEDSIVSPQEKIRQMIVKRQERQLEETLLKALEQTTAEDLINTVLLPAMKEVGEKFASGELILPFVLQSAEVMKKAVVFLEAKMEKKIGFKKAVVVLATVWGDVHDIGKNLVKTILVNNGYQVIDLGKQQTVENIVAAAIEHQADAIGLSALLVSTSLQMPLVIKECARRGLNLPVLIGGAAVNKEFSLRIINLDNDTLYQPGVFYAKDAFEGLEIMNNLSCVETVKDYTEKVLKQAQKISEKSKGSSFESAADSQRPGFKTFVAPRPPFEGNRVLNPQSFDYQEIFKFLNTAQLFKLNWAGKATKTLSWNQLLEQDFKPRLESIKKECIEKGWLKPAAVYGFFKCKRQQNKLKVGEVEFEFKPDSAGNCLIDYFNPQGENWLALQLVTAGSVVSKIEQSLETQGAYSQEFYLHGLAVQFAEALAEWTQRKVLKQWGVSPQKGSRYSPGYPLWPNLEDQKKIFKLLRPEQIGVELSAGLQMIPEASTSALVVPDF